MPPKSDAAYIKENDIRFPEFEFFQPKSQSSSKDSARDKPRIIRNFDNILLDPDVRSILKSLNYDEPTAIQAVTIPQILDGKDVIGISRTGSGKTLAFALPIILKYKNAIINDQFDKGRKVAKPRVLILTPTRELALQVHEAIHSISMDTVPTYCVYGGTDRLQQMRQLGSISPLVIVATPGRFKDFLDNKVFTTNEIEMLVLDEADRMLDKGFYPDVEYILKFIPKKRQILLFSATWNEDLHDIVRGNMTIENLFKVSVGSIFNEVNKDILQIPLVIGDFQKLYVLSHIVGKSFCGFKILVFFNRTDTVHRMVEHFQGEKIAPAYAFSSLVPQDKREYLINRFRQGKIKVLFATDAAARGLDIDDIHLVINYDFPATLDTYIHRIGRTGRNGKYGQAISFVPCQFRATKNFSMFMDILERGTADIPKEFMTPEDPDSD